MPHVQKLQEELTANRRDDVLILSFNSGNDSLAVAEGLWEDEGFDFAFVMDEKGKEGRNVTNLGVRMFPTNFVIDADGKVVMAQIGYGKSIEAEIRKLLGLE